MTDYTANVLRERFEIAEIDSEAPSIIALSNRYALLLKDSQGREVEKFVVRGQMLHTVVRLCGAMLQMFQRTGPLMNRQVPLDWDHLWENAAGHHERSFNPNLWVAVYHDGKPVFQSGAHHAFLDILEQVEAKHSRDYDNSLKVAEKMFSQAGHPVSIHHDANVALTFHIGGTSGKVGVILRGARKTTTFTFAGEKSDSGMKALNPVHFINTAAAFLEGIQLCFVIGNNNEKLRHELITAYSDEGQALTSARARLQEINTTIHTFENMHDVHYRPEKPNFAELVINAEHIARKRIESIDM